MEIEKLKLILDALQGVGHEAGSLATLYLWLQFGASVVTSLSFVAVFLGISYGIYRFIIVSNHHEATDQFFRDMRDRLGTGTGGHLTENERHRTMASLRQLANKPREKDHAA